VRVHPTARSSRRSLAAPGAFAALVLFLVFSGTAHAQSATSYRASAARATVGTTVVAEPRRSAA
jgi:hypothetical protein